MLKSWRKSPLFLKRLASIESLELLGKKTSLLVNCRCIYLSSILEKKSKKPTRKNENDAERLKREAPLIFKVTKSSKHISAGIELVEKPLVFQPIKVNTRELEDDLSYLGHDTIVHSAKKERVFVIQPNFKWGPERMVFKLADHRLTEAEALISSVHTWAIHVGCIEPVQEQNPKFYFGSGKVLELSEKIRDSINNHGVTMVFVNTGSLSLRQSKELEAVWGCKVFDRYRVVLELFKERAQTKEAKLQVRLAEIQYMRTHLTTDDLHYDQQRGGGKGMSGGGETNIEKSRRILDETEIKIKKALQLVKLRRNQAKSERLKKRVPQVAMVGYTNAGKTTLAKILSQDAAIEPEDKLFATLDTTAHRGKLPSGLSLVFIDTVGFISDLPHELVESFSATLDDVKTADLLVHVTDCSHPEFESQKDTVENVLHKLDIPEELMNNRITVLNKIDLVGSQTLTNLDDPDVIPISATKGIGIEELRKTIESIIIKSTGRAHFKVNLNLQGQELSWLHRNGTVLDTIPHDNGTLDVIAMLDEANKNKFEKQFKIKLG